MLKDSFKMALENMTHRRMRTFLTLIGIFVGIAAVVGLISLTQGFQNYLNGEFKALGSDKIIISPLGSSFSPTDNPANPLTLQDVDAVKRTPGVKDVTYYRYKTAKIDWGKDDTVYALIITYPLDSQRTLLEETTTLKTIDGRMLKDNDKFSALIGYQYKYNPSFNRNIGPGDKVDINGQEFRVVGVNHKVGNDADDQTIYIPESAFDVLFNNSDDVSSIIVRVADGKQPSEVAKAIAQSLRKHRNLREGEEDFEVTTFEQLIQTFLTVFAVVSFVLIGIAAISLVVGGIGIMSTMYTAVLERTKQIGIMKAIGAKNSDILTIFLIESGLLGLVGGAIGVVLGLGMAKAIEIIGTQYLGTELLKAAMPAWLIFGALAFSFFLGAVSGFMPAKKASQMKPVDSLRYE